MDTFALVILVGAACGLIMVVGSIVLLYKGAISLAQASGEEAVSVEFKKMLKVTTHYPALGLFVIGLAFVAIALWFSKPAAVRPLQVLGKIELQEPDASAATVTISVGQWIARPSSEGDIAQTITMYPNADLLVIETNAPGRLPLRSLKRLEAQDLRSGTVSLADIVLAAPTVPRPRPDPSVASPVDVALPPLAAGAAFR